MKSFTDLFAMESIDRGGRGIPGGMNQPARVRIRGMVIIQESVDRARI